jgi:PAS domain S-box-containing protein
VLAAWQLYTTAENRYVKEAFPIRSYVRDTLIQLLNEETGVRGYLITGDRSSLQPYDAGRPTAAADLAALHRLTARRPQIAADVAVAGKLVTDLNKFYARQIALVDSGRAGQLRAQRNVLAGKALFDRFRASSDELVAEADAVVASAHTSQRRTFWTTLTIALAAGVSAAVVALWLLLSVPKRIWSLYDVERGLREAAERGERASRSLAHVEDAVILLDPDGSIRYWNPAASTYLGVAESVALGQPIDSVVPELADLQQLLERDGRGWLTPISRSGSERWLVVRERDFVDGRVLVLQDVTGERELERARSDFVATASHELRTPLSAVYGAVRTLRRGGRPHDRELDERLLAMIESESERLKEIVEQILTSADIDRNEIRLQLQRCNLRELIETAVEAVWSNAPTNIEFVVDAPDEIELDCDGPKLRQIVINLLDNAIKYSPDGGQIEIRLREQNHMTTIEVTDHGVGIPATAHERIFEKFVRLDPEMRRGVGGTGLGLYISRELVVRMNGQLQVRSTPGKGSTFTIELPGQRQLAPL